MEQDRILMQGLDADAARRIAAHASTLGLKAAEGGEADLIVAPAADAELVKRLSAGAAAVAALGVALDADAQARALDAGAAEVIDLAWAPALVERRLSLLLERRRLQRRIDVELAAKRRELADARALQLTLAPRPDPGPPLRVDVVLEPAMELGGDLVDYVVLNDGRYMLALGDVSGKGAAAALTMARTHTLLRSLALRSYAGELLSPPDTAAHRLNGMLAIDNESCMFVTMFLGLLDPASGEIAYVRCGQIPPFLRRRDGTVERLEAVGGPPLGVVEGVRYAVGRAVVEPGESLLIVSDGVTEAEDAEGRLLGEPPVTEWLESGGDDLAQLVALARDHEAGRPPTDDLAALFVHRPAA